MNKEYEVGDYVIYREEGSEFLSVVEYSDYIVGMIEEKRIINNKDPIYIINDKKFKANKIEKRIDNINEYLLDRQYNQIGEKIKELEKLTLKNQEIERKIDQILPIVNAQSFAEDMKVKIECIEHDIKKKFNRIEEISAYDIQRKVSGHFEEKLDRVQQRIKKEIKWTEVKDSTLVILIVIIFFGAILSIGVCMGLVWYFNGVGQ